MGRRRGSVGTMALVGCVAAVWLPPAVCADEPAAAAEDEALVSGPQVGETVPTFFIRDVTGRQPNAAVCYVCRNGNRPVIMVVARRLDEATVGLLDQINGEVQANRARGLRAFGVFVPREPGELAPQLMTLHREHRFSIPLTIAGPYIEGRASVRIHPEADLTIVLYEHRRVVATFAYREGEFNEEQAANIIEAIPQILPES